MRSIRMIIVLVSMLSLLVACTSGSQPTPGASATLTPAPALTPTPTATPAVPPGTVLFQSDWSHGMKSWGTTHWSVVQGDAQSDLSDHNALTIPYSLALANYAVEFRFQIVSVPINGGYLLLQAKKTTGKDGYVAGILNLLSPAPHSEFANPSIQVYIDPLSDMDHRTMPSDYEPGSIWHTYRVEIRGPLVVLFTDGLRKAESVSARTDQLSNGPLQLAVAKAIVRIASVQVTAL